MSSVSAAFAMDLAANGCSGTAMALGLVSVARAYNKPTAFAADRSDRSRTPSGFEKTKTGFHVTFSSLLQFWEYAIVSILHTGTSF